MSSENLSGLEEESESNVYLVKEILVQDHFYRKYSTITSFLNWIICLPLLMTSQVPHLNA